MTPKRFEHAALENFRVITPSQGEAIAAVRAWLQSIEAGPMLALIGTQGAGKSHLLYSALRAIRTQVDTMDPKERAQSGAVYPYVAPWYRLADHLRYGAAVTTEAGTRQRDAHEVRSELWSRKIVLLDEVRRTSGTDFDDSELAKFACHAYDNRIAVLLTTNVNPLTEVMGPAAASRFTQVVIDGPDARQAA